MDSLIRATQSTRNTERNPLQEFWGDVWGEKKPPGALSTTPVSTLGGQESLGLGVSRPNRRGLEHLWYPLHVGELDPAPPPANLARGRRAPLGSVLAWEMRGLRRYLEDTPTLPQLPQTISLREVHPPSEEGHTPDQKLEHGPAIMMACTLAPRDKHEARLCCSRYFTDALPSQRHLRVRASWFCPSAFALPASPGTHCHPRSSPGLQARCPLVHTVQGPPPPRPASGGAVYGLLQPLRGGGRGCPGSSHIGEGTNMEAIGKWAGVRALCVL